MPSFTFLTKSKSVIVTFAIAVVLLVYRAIDALGNVEFILQKLGVREDVAAFFGSSRGIDFLVTISLLALVLTVAFQLKRQSRSGGDASNTTAITDACPDVSLHDLADDQAKSIDFWVYIDACKFGSHDLLRLKSPFIDFHFSVRNTSVHTIAIGEANGVVNFNEPLDGQVTLIKSLDNVGPGAGRRAFQSDCVMRLTLSEESATRMLNVRTGEFDFNHLAIWITGKKVERQQLVIRCNLDTEALFAKYPKLTMVADEARVSEFWNRPPLTATALRDGEVIGTVINIRIRITNERDVPIYIQRFKLVTTTGGERHTPAETGDIKLSAYLQDGSIARDGDSLKNLNVCPILAERGHQIDGWLQFIIRGVRGFHIQPATVIAIDARGEQHSLHCMPSALRSTM